MTTGRDVRGEIFKGIKESVQTESYADWCVLRGSPHYKIRDELNDIFIQLSSVVSVPFIPHKV